MNKKCVVKIGQKIDHILPATEFINLRENRSINLLNLTHTGLPLAGKRLHQSHHRGPINQNSACEYASVNTSSASYTTTYSQCNSEESGGHSNTRDNINTPSSITNRKHKEVEQTSCKTHRHKGLQ